MASFETNLEQEDPSQLYMGNGSLDQDRIVGTTHLPSAENLAGSNHTEVTGQNRFAPGILIQKISSIKDVTLENWSEHDKKHALLLSWIGYSSFKLAGRIKLPDAAIGYVSMGAYTATNSAALTALSAAVLSTGWSRSAAGAMNYTIDNNKKAYETTGANFKNLNDNFELLLPGFDSYHKEQQDKPVDGEPLLSSMRKNLSMRTRRGIVATNRLTPYISAAGRAGHTRKERQKLANAISVESGIIKGAVYLGIAGLISKTADSNPYFAENVQNTVKNPIFWGVIGGVTMVGEFSKNKINARRSAKQQIS